MNFRNNFTRLAESLIQEGKLEEATNVADRCFELMPHESIPYNLFVLPLAEIYYTVNQAEKGNAVLRILADKYEEELEYYFSIEMRYLKSSKRELQQAMSIMQRLSMIADQYEQDDLGKDLNERFKLLEELYVQRMTALNQQSPS